MEHTERELREIEKWPGRRIQPLVIAVMATMLIVGLVVIFESIAPSEPWKGLLIIAFVVSLQASLTTNWLDNHPRRIKKFTFRTAEVLLIIVLLRPITWMISGGFPAVAEFRTYFVDPLQLFDFFFVASAICILFVWDRANALSSIFSKLSINEVEIEYFSNINRRSEVMGSIQIPPINRGALVRSYYREWMIGGIILVVAAALTTVRLPEIGQSGTSSFDLRNVTRLGMPSQIMFALMVYFLAGLWLGSQARLAAARGRWLMDGIEPDDQLHRSWQRFSIVILVAIALVAAFVPIGSTIAISKIIQIAVSVIFGIISLIVFAVTYVLAFLTSKVPGAEPQEEVVFESISPEIPEPGQILSQGGETLDRLFGVLFWITILAVTILSFWYFLSNRGIRLNFSAIGDLFRVVLNWLGLQIDSVRKELVKMGQSVQKNMKTSIGISLPDGTIYSFIRLNALKPRDQVRYFYLSLVKRAGRQGVIREIDSTPLEYSRKLKSNWSEVSDEIDLLTASFIRARYSSQEIMDEDVSRAKQIWKKVRSLIRAGVQN